MFGLSVQELVVVAVVAVLLFGRNLPDVARKAGKSYKQFRSGLNDLQSQLNVHELYDSTPSHRPQASKRKVYDDYEDRDEVSAPKFEPPPAEPQAENRGTEAA